MSSDILCIYLQIFRRIYQLFKHGHLFLPWSTYLEYGNLCNIWLTRIHI